jgi:transcriptional regulator with XRE-family HTH domain
MKIGEWVREARKARGWSQETLAEKLGREKANISHWETGKHEPSFGQLLLIRDLTGHPLHDVGVDPSWPMPKIPREMITSLPADKLEQFQVGVRAALAAVTAAAEDEQRASDAPRKRGQAS